MFFVISLVIGAVSLGAIYFSRTWSWATLILAAMLLLIPLSGLKSKKQDLRSKKLSDAANSMLEKYGHYYSMPAAAKDFGKAAVVLHACGTIAAVADIFMGYWNGVLIGIVYFVALGMLARAFDPNNFLYDPAEKAVHAEIQTYLSADNGGRQAAGKRQRRANLGK
jgi:hypothetical protein